MKFPKVCHFPSAPLPCPSQAEQLPKLPIFLLLTPLFWGYLNSQIRISKMVHSLDYYPCSSRLALRIHPSYFYKLPRALSLSRMLTAFSIKLLYFTMCGKNVQIYGVHILWKCIDWRYFYSCPSLLKTRPQVLVIIF